MLPDLVKKVYVINLKHCTDRRRHIEEEFKREGILNYEIFEATSKDSVEVQDIMMSDFVMKYPPCFRCRRVKCRCENNILINSQIGNWCSFINVMKDIVKNKFEDLIMICEDDIKITNNGMYIFNKVLTKEYLEQYNIDFEKPILIRAEQRGDFPSLESLKLTKAIKMSNACFLINHKYAVSFLKYLTIIDRTSDMYIQSRLLMYDRSIQSFTIEPSPVYQLSCNKDATFSSEIHPKGINKEDSLKDQCHFKRIEYDDFVQNMSEDIFVINNSFKMFLPKSNTDGIFMTLRRTRQWEPTVTQKLLASSENHKINAFVDIGANIGYYTLLFANKGINTHSFEPNIDNYGILQRNIELNDLSNVLTYNVGLSDKNGELDFYYRPEKSGHGSFNKDIVHKQKLNLCKKVQIQKLDDIDIKEDKIMIKIDIEGHELFALMGMKLLLDTGNVKVLCIEISRKFYGRDTEREILNILGRYFTKMYIVQLKQEISGIPLLEQYDLICSQ